MLKSPLTVTYRVTKVGFFILLNPKNVPSDYVNAKSEKGAQLRRCVQLKGVSLRKRKTQQKEARND